MLDGNAGAQLKIAAFIDFDGTITFEDTTDAILERFADERWHDIEREWIAGRIGSRECLSRQIDLVRAFPEEIDDFAHAAEFDETFPEFVAFCRQHNIDLNVVSDGFDRVARTVLAGAGLADVGIISNHLEWLGADRWRLGFPYSRGDCQSSAGNCKCSTLTGRGETLSVLIGDGRSDICASGIADVVLARDSLAVHCRSANRRFSQFTNFASVIGLFEELIEVHAPHHAATSALEMPVYAQRA